MAPPVEDPEPSFWHRHLGAVSLACFGLLLAVIIIIELLEQGDIQSWLRDQSDGWVYFTSFALVALDAVVPIFPGETTLNAVSTLAAHGADLELGRVMFVGALGALVGDSTLFWITRANAARIQPQLEKALANPQIRSCWELLESSSGLLIVGGRYVPGMRFAVNATMGLSPIRYRRFLFWSAIGAVLWSVYTCALAYEVATTVAGYPLASLVISGLITTVAIAAMVLVYRRRKPRADPATAP